MSFSKSRKRPHNQSASSETGLALGAAAARMMPLVVGLDVVSPSMASNSSSGTAASFCQRDDWFRDIPTLLNGLGCVASRDASDIG